VTKYIITIAPDADAAGAPTATAKTTVRIDASSGDVRITELTVRAGQGQGLDPADLPAVDLGLLIRALAGPASVPALPASASATPAPQSPAADAAPAEELAHVAVATRAKTAPRGRRSGPTKAVRASRTKRSAAVASAEASGKRAYRRMPDPAKVLAAYAKTGSLSALAAHFDVPRHTVVGWARRLRDQGHAIGGR
jgi:hypothetical protein